MTAGLFPVLRSQFRHFIEHAGDMIMGVLTVRYHTAAAVFDLFISSDIFEISAAAVSQRVQRTVAEHAVEFVRICHLMTWELLTFLIAEKSVAVFHFYTSIKKDSTIKCSPYS